MTKTKSSFFLHKLKDFFSKTEICENIDTSYDGPFSEDEKIALIEENFKNIFKILDLNLDDESLNKSPFRIAKMYVRELFSGLNKENYPKISLYNDFSSIESKEVVYIKNITVNSVCEHHFLPIVGKCHIAYIPNKKLIGLSKVNRIVNYYSKRPQLQEKLNAQIAKNLSFILNTKNVAVFIEATHLCVTFRGVQDISSKTASYNLLGKFKEDKNLRDEFFKNLSI